ncbi:MAG TPA: hypothetical protein VGJ93_02480 [Desulfuromonadaceae bacterium]|jgi:hypothetical protein
MIAHGRRKINLLMGLFLVILMSGCSTKYITSQGQEIILQEHEALFLNNCENNKWWDKHPPAANCGFFGKDILRSDPVGGLRYLKRGCDNGDDLSCLEFAGNAYKLSTDDKRYKLIRSYKLPMEELVKARSYSLDLCLNRKIVLNGADNSKWLCFFSGKLYSDVDPIDKTNASKAFKENCDKRGDCEELKKSEGTK